MSSCLPPDGKNELFFNENNDEKQRYYNIRLSSVVQRVSFRDRRHYGNGYSIIVLEEKKLPLNTCESINKTL